MANHSLSLGSFLTDDYLPRRNHPLLHPIDLLISLRWKPCLDPKPFCRLWQNNTPRVQCLCTAYPDTPPPLSHLHHSSVCVRPSPPSTVLSVHSSLSLVMPAVFFASPLLFTPVHLPRAPHPTHLPPSSVLLSPPPVVFVAFCTPVFLGLSFSSDNESRSRSLPLSIPFSWRRPRRRLRVLIDFC